ncbi:hypothetical protein WG219_06790 [Ectopseudomonas mendocina]|uniref:DUF2975 domain-containing protein n=1 Tax=Ectopseudomonas mendocina TaxID=300 RepID=A0ABZ2RJI4_ECTME
MLPLADQRPHKLYLLGMGCMVLAWFMACAEIGVNTHLWVSGLSEQGYRQAWSDEMPGLLSEAYAMSSGSRLLLMLLDYAPVLISVLGLILTGLFFRRLAKGELWTRRNASTLVYIGLLSILELLLQPVLSTLEGLVLSMNLPEGERVLSVSVGFSSEAAYTLVKAIFLCSFGLIMGEARKLDEEVKSII